VRVGSISPASLNQGDDRGSFGRLPVVVRFRLGAAALLHGPAVHSADVDGADAADARPGRRSVWRDSARHRVDRGEGQRTGPGRSGWAALRAAAWCCWSRWSRSRWSCFVWFACRSSLWSAREPGRRSVRRVDEPSDEPGGWLRRTGQRSAGLRGSAARHARPAGWLPAAGQSAWWFCRAGQSVRWVRCAADGFVWWAWRPGESPWWVCRAERGRSSAGAAVRCSLAGRDALTTWTAGLRAAGWVVRAPGAVTDPRRVVEWSGSTITT
jgi:hypothetical protein